MIGVRCKTCGRPGLPPVPASKLGSGEPVTHPVAHVHGVHDGVVHTFEPCFAGVSRAELAACVDPDHFDHERVKHAKEMIWTTEALWDL